VPFDPVKLSLILLFSTYVRRVVGDKNSIINTFKSEKWSIGNKRFGEEKKRNAFHLVEHSQLARGVI
jgi:hypothetical protein